MGAVGQAKNGRGRVLDRIARGQGIHKGTHRENLPEEKSEQVETMARVIQVAATTRLGRDLTPCPGPLGERPEKFRRTAVTRPIVPVGQDLPNLAVTGVKSLVKADHEMDVGRFAGRSHPCPFGRRQRQRFFAQDVLAPRRGDQHVRAMSGDRGRNVDRLDLGIRCQFLDRPVRAAGAVLLGEGVGRGPIAPSNRDQLGVRRLAQCQAR